MVNKKIFGFVILILIGIFVFSYGISAMPIPPSCCENPPTGESCKMVSDSLDCGSGALSVGVSCDKSANCVRGCCYNAVNGIYMPNVLQKNCKESFLKNDLNCVTLNGARRGCCVLGDSQTYFINQKQCELKTPRDKELNWSESTGEVQCLLLQTTRNEGACVISTDETKSCRITTRQDCISLTGMESSFYEGYLCTASELNTTCKKSTNTNCFEEKDEVYFLDSCGNKANIYDSSKVNDLNYWEKIIKRNNSCGYTSSSGNANSANCGNCDRFAGGICASKTDAKASTTYGNYVCKSTSCIYGGRTYKNGESWCEYESRAGDGKDVVGARHFRYVCNYGDIDIVKCSDYRNQMCVQKEVVDSANPNKKASLGDCVANDWMSCLTANNIEGDMKLCSEISSCMIKNIVMGNFTKNSCLPRVAPGFNTQSEEEVSAFTGVCNYGSASCVVKEKCTYDCEGKLQGCRCVENCECLKQEFTDKMNEICTSVGDCGLKFNTQGKFTKNFEVIGNKTTKNISSSAFDILKSYVNPIAGEYILPAELSLLEVASLPGNTGSTSGTNDAIPGDITQKEETSFTQYLWPIGIAVVAVALKGGFFGVGEGTTINALSISGEKGLFGNTATGGVGWGKALTGAGIGWFAGGYISGWLGNAPGSTGDLVAKIGTSLIGTGIGLGGLSGILSSPLSWGVSNWLVVAGIIATIISPLFGDGEEECPSQTIEQYSQVIFNCKPWTPISGGADCEKCNNNPLRPCSEYACNSLGASCKLLNIGTDHEICDNAHLGDMTAPNIGEMQEQDERIRYSGSGNNIQISGRSGGCLDPYMVYMLGIKTDEPSQCRYDFERKEIFEDLEYEFGNGYVYNHVARVQIPSINSISNWDGKLTMYVRCRDVQNNLAPVGEFYKIQMCVNPEKDLRPPIVTVLPANGSYIKMSTTQQQIIVYTDEPAECRWSNEIKDYSVMENELTCNNQITQGTILGWGCNATLSTPSNKNTFYIRCLDQPELKGKNESLRIVNQQSTEITLLKALTPLTITGIAPKGEFETTSALTLVSLNAVTSGGAGETSCKYSFTGYDNMIPVYLDNGDSHEQVFDSGLAPGNYKIYVECTDKATDSARGETSFQIIYDSSATKISRAFVKDNLLKIFSVKDRECKYSIDKSMKCNFDYNEGIQMGISKEHSISMIKGQVYYIKCSNKFGEVPISCTEIFSPV